MTACENLTGGEVIVSCAVYNTIDLGCVHSDERGLVWIDVQFLAVDNVQVCLLIKLRPFARSIVIGKARIKPFTLRLTCRNSYGAGPVPTRPGKLWMWLL